MNSLKPIVTLLTCISLASCTYFSETTKSKIIEHKNQDKSIAKHIEGKLYHSGGVFNDKDLCPKSPYDTITPVSSLAPSAPEGTPEMTVEGLNDFIRHNDIATIEALLEYFPDHYRNNFSLVEHTRATGQSNLEYPRIVLFGSDGRFMLNVGTKPDDPAYNKLDVAELDTQTGQWEFSVFDFDTQTPSLTRNDPSCVECHGSTNARPFWGSFQQWTGVFGDSIVDGPRPEALDHTHANKMNQIMMGKGNSKRLEFLKWRNQPLSRGGVRLIADHDFGPELLLSNMAFGTANALGAYIRLSQKYPTQYKAARKNLLLAYFKLRADKPRHFIKVNHSRATFEYSQQMNHKIKQILAQETITPASVNQMLLSLGLDTKEAFSMGTLHQTEAPQTDWSMAAADQYDLVMLQILDDLRRDDRQIAQLLTTTSVNTGIFQCPDTAKTIADMVDFKMLHLFQLAGESKYKVNWVYYPKDVEDIYDQVFLPIAEELIPLLSAKISTQNLAMN